MQKMILFTFLSILLLETFAQVRPARKKHYEKFFYSTTYVVEDRDPFSLYNSTMKKAMEKHWNITEFKFISYSEFQRMRTNEDASFMIFANIKQNNLDQTYEFINFVMGDKKREFEKMPDLASVPLSYLDADDFNYLYKMGVFVKFMQTYVQMQATTPRMRLSNVWNVQNKEVHAMELWLLEEELAENVNTPDKIREFYPFIVKIVTRDEIEEAIYNDREDVAILHKIGPEDTTRSGRGKCWKFIVSVKDGRILFSSQHDVDRQNPDALLADDLVKIAEE